jgi:hypothetical protein
MTFLLAAEADRIQDLIFRSSRLREVVGGSQLLSNFCEDVPELLQGKLGIEGMTPVTRGGGSFRLTFGTAEDAHRFGAALAEAYSRATGATLTVAGPVEVADDTKEEWRAANDAVGRQLRRAKQEGVPVASAHLPFIAYCESCGVGLAEAHGARPGEMQGRYLCASCRAKAGERTEKGPSEFLGPFYDAVKTAWGKGAPSQVKWSLDADAVGAYDPRGYVAYIVADGDSMGQVFRMCDRQQAAALSKEMEKALRETLAEPTGYFMCKTAKRGDTRVPVLPLIMGGDDLFALVPAPYALDIARRLCRRFQQRMTHFVREQEIEDHESPGGKLEITMTAVVVLCKANYPYYLAHDIGERRLSEAKRVVKALAASDWMGDGQPHRLSAVDFEVVLGSQVEPVSYTGEQRPTLRPYWVTSGGDRDGEKAEERQKTAEALRRGGWGLPVQALLDQRIALNEVPSRRLSRLRELLDRVSTAGDDAATYRQWDEELERLMARVERDWVDDKKHSLHTAQEAEDGRHPLRAALEALGGSAPGEWYDVRRESDAAPWRGHGMMDLLRAWDWTRDLDHDPVEYEGGGR